MSPEFWAIAGSGAAIFFAIWIIGEKVDAHLERIKNLLFDIKIGRRD